MELWDELGSLMTKEQDVIISLHIWLVKGALMVKAIQAMEEDVAAMAGPSTAATEQPGMARQDSARELDESTRSPSPTRLTTSPGLLPPNRLSALG